jgi:hypothetical protein
MKQDLKTAISYGNTMDWQYTVEPVHKEDSNKKQDIYIIEHIIKA